MSQPTKYVVCALHRLAHDWAMRQGWSEGEYRVVTQAFGLKGVAATAEIHVIDTRFKFTDHHCIMRLLNTHFKNVTHTRI